MTASPDFAMLPPEINSARMYSGPGPGPLLAAASAWYGLAAELRATALGYGSVLSELTGQAWYGPASASMAAAAAPYVAWMSTTAAQAEETGSQAEAAVAAYEAAFAATVPPPVIAENRARLMILIATNFFGQNTPAIAATEAEYAEMWAQDASAMYGYAGASALASQLTPFDPPQQTANAAGLPAQSAAVGQAAATSAGSGQSTVAQLMSAVPGTLQTLASPSPLAGAGSLAGDASSSWLWDNFGLNANIWNTIFASGFYMPARFLGTAANFMSLSQQAAGGAPGAAEGAAGAAAGAAEGVAPGALGNVGALGNSVVATMGRGGLVGPLSVPQGWTAATPSQSPLASAMGGAPLEEPAPATASTPPVPLAGYMGGQGEGRAVPQYGFRPSFVARPPAAG
ncbi:PPE family protein [Mycobacterium sp. 663a-19]|uniref:PPE family protein n=1 Tax=Mycobacterium sp. 663a-19 TaxID=2986148 RepID=UPI002D1E9292|nr:PPE family protein [Mycobacterium sp. 663a-19]MEB3981321.1 PPE family protein [Mycobacterium sp. 663a-19]